MNLKKVLLAGTGAAVAAVVIGTGGAQAAVSNLIGSNDIKDGSVRVKDLRPGAVDRLSGSDGDVTTIVGSGYAGLGGHDYWAPNSYGETIETCPAGQTAIGGGFSQDASTGVDGKYDLGGKADVQVTVSAPYFKGDYVPVDDAGNFRADQWVVRGFNHSDQQVDVRAWVVCAPLAN
jgi:hypothetical protein